MKPEAQAEEAAAAYAALRKVRRLEELAQRLPRSGSYKVGEIFRLEDGTFEVAWLTGDDARESRAGDLFTPMLAALEAAVGEGGGDAET